MPIIQIAAVTFVLVLLAGFALSRAAANRRSMYYRLPAGESILYLASGPQTVNDDLGISVEDLELQGMTIYYEFDELKRAADSFSHPADAIVVHVSRLSEVDQEWLRAKFRSSVIVAGVNITIRELADYVGDTTLQGDEAWTDGWQGGRFFSVIGYKPTGTSEEQQLATQQGLQLAHMAHSTDNIQSPDDVGFFLSIIRRNISDFSGDLEAEPTPTGMAPAS
jgi:hypothetical protein